MAMSWKDVRALLDGEGVLRRMGLEARTPGRDLLTGVGLFSVGMLVGAGIGMLFAPRRGEELRAMMSGAWHDRPGAGRRAEGYRGMGAEAAGMPTGQAGH